MWLLSIHFPLLVSAFFFRVLIPAWLVVAVAPAFAQFSAGPDLVFPHGSWSDWGDAGFGASVRYDATLRGKLNCTASLGFLAFIGKSYSFKVPAASYTNEMVMPLTGGIKYYFHNANRGVYGAADAGFFFSNNNQGVKFGLSPGFGYRIDRFDFSFRYSLITDLSYWGLRAAYIFSHK